jgi:hypothetical protein
MKGNVSMPVIVKGERLTVMIMVMAMIIINYYLMQ